MAAEALPSRDDRRSILLYEAAEGGAGVLRRLVDDSGALRLVGVQALHLCHFDPRTGVDLRRAPGAREDCEAACYDCLMSYTNQPDHRMLDRQAVRDFLMQLTQSTVVASPAAKPRAEHLSGLMNQCDSELEREWLRFIDGHGLRLPSGAQVFVEACRTRPDFTYRSHLTAVYVDGPAHEYSERQARDRAQTECMEDHGYTVIRFGHKEDWGNIIARHPNIFGKI